MTDDERAARKWFNHIAWSENLHKTENAKNAATILRLLDRPVLPRGADVPESVLKAMLVAYQEGLREPGPYWTVMRGVVDALHAHLTAPLAVKKIERWEVIHPGYKSGIIFHSEAEALDSLPSGGRVVKLVEAADE